MSEMQAATVNLSKKDIAIRLISVLLILFIVVFVIYAFCTWNRVNSVKVEKDKLCNGVFISSKIRLVIGSEMEDINIYLDNEPYCYSVEEYEDNVLTYIDENGKERYILIMDEDTVYLEVENEVLEREK